MILLIGLIIAAILGWDWVFWIIIIGWVLSRITSISDAIGKFIKGDWTQKLGAAVELLWQGALVALGIYIYALGS